MDERQRSRSQELFQDKPVWNAIFAMAVPSCISILVMVCYNMADMFFVGQLGDTAQVAAVSVAGPVFSLITAVSTMIGMGGCSVIAQTAGQGKLREAKIYSSMCFYTAVFLGLLCTVVVLTGADSILKALGANEEILPFAGSYMRILAAGAVAMLLSVVLSSLIRADGAVREGLIGNLAGTAVNIVLDPIFILVLDMGIAGAAIATLIGNVVSSSFYLWYILKKAEYLSIRPFFGNYRLKEFFHILAVGMPNGISSLLAGAASAFSNQLLSAYGTDAIAAMAAAGKTTMVISMLQMGICMGVQPMMAYNYGAGNKERLQEILKKLAILTLLIGSAAMLGCFFGRGAIIGMFLKNAQAAAMGERLVIFLLIASPVIGWYYIGTNFLQASGNAAAATVVSLTRQGIILIPCLYLMNTLMGFTGIAAAHTAADILSVIISLAVCRMKNIAGNPHVKEIPRGY